MKIGLIGSAVVLLLAAAPATAQLDYRATAGAHAECFTHDHPTPHYAFHTAGSASAWKDGTNLPGELYIAEVTGTNIADSDAGTIRADASDSWSGDVTPGFSGFAEAYAEAKLGGMTMAIDAAADRGTCSEAPPGPSLPEVDGDMIRFRALDPGFGLEMHSLHLLEGLGTENFVSDDFIGPQLM